MTHLVFMEEIGKAYTDTVKEYMDCGMEVHLGSMSGSQGEIAKIDLHDATDVYRIRLSSDTKFPEAEDGNRFSVHMITLDVERFVNEYHPNAPLDTLGGTLWNGRGESLLHKEWYSPDYRSRVVYFESYEDIKAFGELRYKRIMSKGIPEIERELPLSNEKVVTRVRDIVRKHKGYMRIKRTHIKRVVRIVNRKSAVATYKIEFTDDCGKAPLTISVFRKANAI